MNKVDAIALTGLCMLSAGLLMVWPPLALIVPGSVLVAWVMFLTTPR